MIFRYVTEATFDSYLWQTLETKQRFISQIMTSKSPVRSCDDLDEAALSYAEIKALCAGNPKIKQKMDLDVEVAKLKLLKANHQSTQYKLEDNLLRYFPENIKQSEAYIKGFEADLVLLAQSEPKEDVFSPMTIKGDTLTDKDNAGAAILEACKDMKSADSVEIGSYRGFTMHLSFDAFSKQHRLTLKGAMSHSAALGMDARGNLVRIENALQSMTERLTSVRVQLENLLQQQEAARAELGKPFLQEDELREKTALLAQLDAELNLSNPTPECDAFQTEMIPKAARPSVLETLKQMEHQCPETRAKQGQEQEVR